MMQPCPAQNVCSVSIKSWNVFAPGTDRPNVSRRLAKLHTRSREGKRRAVPQDGVCLCRVCPLAVMQDQTCGEPQWSSRVLSNLHENSLRSVSSARPKGKNANAFLWTGLKCLAQPIGAQDHGHRSARGEARKADSDPAIESDAIGQGARPILIRRNLARALVKRRIAEHVIESPSQVFWQLERINLLKTYISFKGIGACILDRKSVV